MASIVFPHPPLPLTIVGREPAGQYVVQTFGAGRGEGLGGELCERDHRHLTLPKIEPYA